MAVLRRRQHESTAWRDKAYGQIAASVTARCAGADLLWDAPEAARQPITPALNGAQLPWAIVTA
jgi:hypothetical protein